MSVYSINSNRLNTIYEIDGTATLKGYDILANEVFPNEEPVDPYLPDRTLVFEDDFNGQSLNTENWSCVVRAGNTGQLQYYKQENVYLEDGKLVIEAKKEPYEGYAWTSGRIESRNKKYWRFGRIEAKIKFPKLTGVFPAFWTMGQNNLPNPQCGEIDIVEIMPRGNPEIDKVFATMWNCSTGANLGTQYIRTSSIDDWHIYSMEWTNEYVAILFDNTEFHRWTFSDYANEEIARYLENQYLIFNLAIGTQGGTPATETDSMKMFVDWVRVYAPLT